MRALRHVVMTERHTKKPKPRPIATHDLDNYETYGVLHRNRLCQWSMFATHFTRATWILPMRKDFVREKTDR